MPAPRGIDVSRPNVARMYDYYLGGKDNFEADRAAAEKVRALIPGLRRPVLENRRFLAGEAGIGQHEWRPVLGQTAGHIPNIQWGAVARKPAR